jgi:hypothetical protein
MTILDVAVIGGGQAGLAIGYDLRRQGLSFRISPDRVRRPRRRAPRRSSGGKLGAAGVSRSGRPVRHSLDNPADRGVWRTREVRPRPVELDRHKLSSQPNVHPEGVPDVCATWSVISNVTTAANGTAPIPVIEAVLASASSVNVATDTAVPHATSPPGHRRPSLPHSSGTVEGNDNRLALAGCGRSGRFGPDAVILTSAIRVSNSAFRWLSVPLEMISEMWSATSFRVAFGSG